MYYIVAKSFVQSSAGVKAMHILCDILNTVGYSAYLVPADSKFHVSPGLNTPILTKNLRDLHYKSQQTAVAIYDESIIGNPLNCPIVVRWYLNRPSFVSGKVKNNFDETSAEYVFAEEIQRDLPRLFVNTIDFDFFFAAPLKKERTLKLFYAGKLRSLGIEVSKPEGTVEIHRSGPKKISREQLRDLFSRARIFYVAEDTAMVLEAAICGCPSIHMTEYFKKPALTQLDGQVGIIKSEEEKIELSREFFERYYATLKIRETADISKFILETQNSFLKNWPCHKIPDFKFHRSSKFITQYFKAKAAFNASGLRGLYAVFYSHYLVEKDKPPVE